MANVPAIDYDPEDARAVVASVLDGSAGDVPLDTFLSGVAKAMSDPVAAMAAVGSRAAPADLDTVLERSVDAWAKARTASTLRNAREARDAEEADRRRSLDASMFRFMPGTDVDAITESASLGDTSPLLAVKERYVFG